MTTHHCPAFSCTDCRNTCCVYSIPLHQSWRVQVHAFVRELEHLDFLELCYEPVLLSLHRTAAQPTVTCT